MTNQLQGEILYEGWSGTASGDWAYTPWMPVRGDYARFAVEVTEVNGVTLTWEVQTRTLDDPTVETTITASTGTSSKGTTTVMNTTKAKQLVRYRFKTGSTNSTSNYVVFRALSPSWMGDR
ncbi:MAG: hypothetical protein JNK15_25085 [Planctomycetes bacterium]|nr:hypothetical protein [Planctomycetota bacterium]